MTHSANKFIFSGEYGELTCFYAHRGLYSNPTMALVRMRSPVRIWLSAPQHLQKCRCFFLFPGRNRLERAKRLRYLQFWAASGLRCPFCQLTSHIPERGTPLKPLRQRRLRILGMSHGLSHHRPYTLAMGAAVSGNASRPCT